MPPPPTFESKFNQLEIGQTTDQVQTLLGTPDLREVVNGVEIWHYSVNDLRRVEFKDKKVTGFARDTAPGSDLAGNSSALPGSLKLGADCKTDKECQSGNCHFKTCSGPNNCFR